MTHLLKSARHTMSRAKRNLNFSCMEALCQEAGVIQANFTVGVLKETSKYGYGVVFQGTDREQTEHLGEAFCFD